MQRLNGRAPNRLTLADRNSAHGTSALGVALVLVVGLTLRLEGSAQAAESNHLQLVQAQLPDVAPPDQLPDRSVRDVSIDIATPGETTPDNVAKAIFRAAPFTTPHEDWLASEFFWTAPAVGYRPLYFEDANLERYGLSYGIFQPALSSGRAFGQFLALPYQMTLQPPHQRVYPLGYYRPGDRVVYQAERWELDARAAAVQAGVVTGFIFLIP